MRLKAALHRLTRGSLIRSGAFSASHRCAGWPIWVGVLTGNGPFRFRKPSDGDPSPATGQVGRGLVGMSVPVMHPLRTGVGERFQRCTVQIFRRKAPRAADAPRLDSCDGHRNEGVSGKCRASQTACRRLRPTLPAVREGSPPLQSPASFDMPGSRRALRGREVNPAPSFRPCAGIQRPDVGQVERHVSPKG